MYMLTHQHFGISNSSPYILLTRFFPAAESEEAVAMRYLAEKGGGGGEGGEGGAREG